MSSLRNAVKRRPYRERSQPKSRQHLGLLEKHKDYVLRAKDYSSKQARLKALREKAAMRNPEEFYHAMVRSKTKDGVHQMDNAPAAIPTRAMRVLKAQDSAYLSTKRSVESKRIERLQASLHTLSGMDAPHQHTIFVDEDDDAEAFDPTAHFQTVPELAHRRFNRLREDDLATRSVIVPKHVGEAEANAAALTKWAEGVKRQRKVAYAELENRKQRKDKISAEIDKIELQRALMGKGAKKKLRTRHRSDDNAPERHPKKATFRWKTERKR